MNIDDIWKQFGEDVKNINVLYEPEKTTWCVKYSNGSLSTHIERDADMSVAAENTLHWYKNSHTYKFAAEAMYNLLDKIQSIIDERETQGKLDMQILELCRFKDEFIKKNDGVLEWNPQYDKQPMSVKKVEKQPVKQTKQQSQQIEEKSLTDFGVVPNDGFPGFFTKQTINSSYSECWGYDVNGNRTHVVLNHTNPEGCKIDNSISNINVDDIVEISESEYNEIYDNVTNTMLAISMGYGIRN